MATLAVAKPPSGARKPSVSQPSPPAPVLSAPPVAQTEVVKHLPTLQSYGTFFNGRRIATPTGEAVQGRRPSSALVCSNRGVSVSAEVRRGDAPKVASTSRPAVSLASCEQFILEAADVLAIDIPAECEPAAMGPRSVAADPSSQGHVVWRESWLRSAAALSAFPYCAAGISNPRRLDMVLRAATLVTALLRFKGVVESGQLPHVSRCGRSNATASLLYNQNISFDASGRRALLCRDNSRHIIVSCGGNHFVVEVQEVQGRWLTSSELAIRLQLVVDLAASMQPSLFAKVCWLSANDHRAVSLQLREVCAANSEALAALGEAMFSVTLCPGASFAQEHDDDEHIPKFVHLSESQGSWLGSGLQLFVDGRGQAVLQGHTVLVNPHVLFNCANQAAHLSKEDALRPYVEPEIREVVAVVRPFVPSKPIDPKDTKAKAPSVGRSDDDGPKCFEVVIPLQVAATPCRLPFVVDLWLPVARAQSLATKPRSDHVTAHSFSLPLPPSYEPIFLLGVLAAFHLHVRRSPAVWYWEVDGIGHPSVWLVSSRTTALALTGMTTPADIAAHTKRYTSRRRCDAAVADLHCRFVAAEANRGPPFVSILQAAGSPSKLARWAVGEGGCCARADLAISRVAGRYPHAAWEVATTQAELGAAATLSYSVLEGAIVCTISSSDPNPSWLPGVKSAVTSVCDALRDHSSLSGR